MSPKPRENCRKWYENPLKRCHGQTRLLGSDNTTNYDDYCTNIGVTQSLENVQNDNNWEAHPKRVNESRSPQTTMRDVVQARRKSFEFEDLTQLKPQHNDAAAGTTYRNVLKYGKSCVKAPLASCGDEKDTSTAYDVTYNNPFDPRLLHYRPDIVKQQNLSMFTPLRHVASRNVFLDVAERISKVMEEYTTKHRSKIVEKIDDRPPECLKTLQVEQSKLSSSQGAVHRKVCAKSIRF